MKIYKDGEMVREIRKTEANTKLKISDKEYFSDWSSFAGVMNAAMAGVQTGLVASQNFHGEQGGVPQDDKCLYLENWWIREQAYYD